MEFPISMADPDLGDVYGDCIATDAVEHITCLYADPGGLPVVIQVSPLVPDFPGGISDDEAKELVGQRAGQATQNVMTALRHHLARAAGGDAVAAAPAEGDPAVTSDPAVIGERLLKLPVDTAMVGEGYRFTEAFSVTGAAVPEGWGMRELVILDFTGPESDYGYGELYAGYMVFDSAEAARTYYEQYPDVFQQDAGTKGWAEVQNIGQDSDDPMREFSVPCLSSEVDASTACLDYVTGTPVIIGVNLPIPPEMTEENRSDATAVGAMLAVSSLLPAARAHLAEAMLQ